MPESQIPKSDLTFWDSGNTWHLHQQVNQHLGHTIDFFCFSFVLQLVFTRNWGGGGGCMGLQFLYAVCLSLKWYNSQNFWSSPCYEVIMLEQPMISPLVHATSEHLIILNASIHCLLLFMQSNYIDTCTLNPPPHPEHIAQSTITSFKEPNTTVTEH